MNFANYHNLIIKRGTPGRLCLFTSNKDQVYSLSNQNHSYSLVEIVSGFKITGNIYPSEISSHINNKYYFPIKYKNGRNFCGKCGIGLSHE